MMNNQNGVLSGLEFMGDNVRNKLKFCGDRVRLYPLCKIISAENAMLDTEAKILDNVWIDAGPLFILGKYSMLTWGVLVEGRAETRIGDRVFVGPGTKILTSTYKVQGFYGMEFLPEGCGEIEYGNITIEDDVYIGANVTILPGVTIHEGAVIGANALVTKDVDAWGVYVGTPCKRIGDRKKPDQKQQDRLFSEIDWNNHL